MAAPSRRRFLGIAVSAAAGAGVIAVGGSAGVVLGRRRDVRPDPVAAPTAPAALSTAIDREQRLLQGHLAAGAISGVAERTAEIVADHTEHLRVLVVELARITGSPTVASDVASRSSSQSPSPAQSSHPSLPLGDQLAALADAESAAAAEGAAQCLAGLRADVTLAQLHVLLGSISASESVHAVMLR